MLIRPFAVARLANLAGKIANVIAIPDSTLREVDPIKLTRKQIMVLYMYARNYSYTEVSTWLTALGHKISPSRVNDHLDHLKVRLGVQSKEALRDMSMKLGYDTAMPIEFVPEGSHDISNDVFDLWIC